MIDYKQKYIELRKALAELKRGKPSESTINLLFDWDAIDFSNSTEYMADAAFDRKSREDFIKILKKNSVDLYRLSWIKNELDNVRIILNGMDESHPRYNWYVVCEIVLGNFLNDSFITVC